MGEPFATVGTHERLLTRMDAYVFLEMVLKLERLAALVTAEFPQIGTLTMAQLVPLETIDVCKLFSALRARGNWVFRGERFADSLWNGVGERGKRCGG